MKNLLNLLLTLLLCTTPYTWASSYPPPDYSGEYPDASTTASPPGEADC